MDWKPLLQNKWLLVLGVIGILCLVLGTIWNGGSRVVATLAPTSPSSSGDPTNNNGGTRLPSSADPSIVYQNLYDEQLTAMLDKMAGVHSVSVMVTVDSTASLSLATNQRSTSQQDNRGGGLSSSSSTTDTQIYTQQNGTPYVITQVTPQVRGVLVTVNADDFYIAKAEIIDAIRNVLGVSAYKISVEPQKGNS